MGQHVVILNKKFRVFSKNNSNQQTTVASFMKTGSCNFTHGPPPPVPPPPKPYTPREKKTAKICDLKEGMTGIVVKAVLVNLGKLR